MLKPFPQLEQSHLIWILSRVQLGPGQPVHRAGQSRTEIDQWTTWVFKVINFESLFLGRFSSEMCQTTGPQKSLAEIDQ